MGAAPLLGSADARKGSSSDAKEAGTAGHLIELLTSRSEANHPSSFGALTDLSLS